MPRQTKPLTNTEVEKAKPKEKEYTLFDGLGLYISIKPTGAKLWRFKYSRPVTKKSALASFGAYPEISLQQARQIREEYRALLARNIDPQTHRQQQKQQAKAQNENTFFRVCELWFKDIYPTKAHNEQTRLKNWERLEKHVFPTLAELPLDEIKPRLLVELYQQIGASNTLDKLHRLIIKTMDHGIKLGIIESHNCNIAKDDFIAPLAKEQPAIHFDELPTLLTLVNSAFLDNTAKHSIESNTFFAFNLSLLTGLRQIEVSTLEWGFIDDEKGVIVVPAKNLKQTRKLKEQPRDHIIPITSQIKRMLDTIASYNGKRHYIFTAPRNQTKPMNSESVAKALRTILKDTHLQGKQNAHGLRSIFRTFLAYKGIDLTVAELALAHLSTSKGKVQERYDRYDYLDERRQALQLWGDYCEQCGLLLDIHSLKFSEK